MHVRPAPLPAGSWHQQKKAEPPLALDQNGPDSIIKVNSILTGAADGVVSSHGGD